MRRETTREVVALHFDAEGDVVADVFEQPEQRQQPFSERNRKRILTKTLMILKRQKQQSRKQKKKPKKSQKILLPGKKQKKLLRKQ